jgi:hypothetical protein
VRWIETIVYRICTGITERVSIKWHELHSQDRGVPHSFSGCISRNFWKNISHFFKISHFSQNFSLFSNFSNFSNFSKFLKFLKFLKISQISQISQNFLIFTKVLNFSQISHFFMNFPDWIFRTEFFGLPLMCSHWNCIRHICPDQSWVCSCGWIHLFVGLTSSSYG